MEIQPGAEIDIGPETSVAAMVARSHDTLEKRFNGREFPFDALICTGDERTVVAIHYLRRRGLRVPEDVAVIGFNDGINSSGSLTAGNWHYMALTFDGSNLTRCAVFVRRDSARWTR